MRVSVSTILMWLIVLGLLSLNIASAISGQSYIAVVSGISMEPILSTGDLVIILPVKDPAEIHVMDVVVYRGTSGVYVIHRVINIVKIGNNTYFITKGDNNLVPDPAPPGLPGIPFENILGKVVSINGSILKIPYTGIISLFRK